MKDYNYWKRAYKNTWVSSSKREMDFAELIKKETNFDLKPYGIGAEQDAFVCGSAEQNGGEKSAPDFRIEGTNIYIEVTGPLSANTKPEKGLWLRPDKLKYAFRHRKTQDEWFVINFPSSRKWYAIHADKFFLKDLCENFGKDYREKTVFIRNRKERYIEISPKNEFVKDVSCLVSHLKNRKGAKTA